MKVIYIEHLFDSFYSENQKHIFVLTRMCARVCDNIMYIFFTRYTAFLQVTRQLPAVQDSA